MGVVMSQAKGFAATLAELDRLGRLEKIDTARVELVRGLATAVDKMPGNASLWRQYREALGELTFDDGGGSFDDAIEELYSKIRDEAPPGTGDVRS